MNVRWLALSMALLAVAALQRPAVVQERSGALIGKQAPQFHIQGIYNEPYSLETFKGHILVMQFGASW